MPGENLISNDPSKGPFPLEDLAEDFGLGVADGERARLAIGQKVLGRSFPLTIATRRRDEPSPALLFMIKQSVAGYWAGGQPLRTGERRSNAPTRPIFSLAGWSS